MDKKLHAVVSMAEYHIDADNKINTTDMPDSSQGVGFFYLS